MKDDPLQSVYSYVERAYVRLQAGDLFTRCLEENSIVPVQQLVDSLVIAGPSSLQTMREILAEASQRKSQVLDDLHQLSKEMEKSLLSYGIRLKDEIDLPTFARIQPAGFLSILKEENQSDESTWATCLQILNDSRDLADTLLVRLNLLSEIESYLQDWMWCVAFMAVHQSGAAQNTSSIC